MKQKLLDLHVHTPCSCDCEMVPAAACRAAVAGGLDGLCFTDHVDFDPRDAGYGFFKWDKYMEYVEGARLHFPTLSILSGFELNWQRRFKKEIKAFLMGKSVDFILGSVHWVSTGFITEPETYRDRSFDDFTQEWVAEVVDLMSAGACDGFAHFDYFYLQTQYLYPRVKREDIFECTLEAVEAIIKADVSLEINTSATRKGLKEPFPCWDFVKRYIREGGTRFHLGSDSHEPSHVAREFPAANRILEGLLKTI
ncbi:MAG: histidinol-phosphatase HisJ family protein [Promethearchaeota archaeon]